MSVDPQIVFLMLVIAASAFLGGVGLTFRILRKRIRSDERERMRVDEHFFSNLKVERELCEESSGHMFNRKKWQVIRERLVYKQFPLSGWMQSKHQIDGTGPDITISVGPLSLLISEAKTPFSIKSIIRQLPEPRDSAALSIPAQGRGRPKSR
jgi:hypothetical protein